MFNYTYKTYIFIIAIVALLFAGGTGLKHLFLKSDNIGMKIAYMVGTIILDLCLLWFLVGIITLLFVYLIVIVFVVLYIAEWVVAILLTKK